MNGIEKITEKIINDAKLDAKAILETAQVEADKIKAKYNIEVDAQKVKINIQAEMDAKSILKHKSDMAELEGRKQLLSTKQAVLDEVFKEAFIKIKALDRHKYIAFLSRMASDASLNGKEMIILSDSDRKTIGNDILIQANLLLSSAGKNASLVLSDEIREIDGGLILKNGDIETNCTFDVLYNIIRNELTTDVADKLFH